MSAVQRIVAVLAFVLVSASARAATEPPPLAPAGVTTARSTPCLMAKYRKQPCAPPDIAEGLSGADLADAHLRRAFFFIDVAELKLAVAECDAALKVAPDDKRARHLSARLALTSGDFERADREIKAALALAPGDPDILATDASRIELLSTPDLALKKFDAIVARYPEHHYSRERRARLLMNFGVMDRAIVDLDVLIAQDPARHTLRTMRGLARLQSGAKDGAIEDLSEAIRLMPQDMRARMARANAYEQIGDDAAALRDYQDILGPVGGLPRFVIAPDELGRLYLQRAFLFVRTNRLDDAADEALAALRLGGTASVLRLQVLLRQNGFPQTPLNGQSSHELRTAVRGCFGLKSCFEHISESL